MIGRIHATVLFVGDLTACAAFYCDTLGFEVKHTDDDSVWFGDQQIHFADPEGNLWEIAHEIAAVAERKGAAAKA